MLLQAGFALFLVSSKLSGRVLPNDSPFGDESHDRGGEWSARTTNPLVLIGRKSGSKRRFSSAVNNGYLWKADEHLNRVAKMRYAHGDELTDLPGVTGIGMGKDHIILYVSDDGVEVPSQVEDVQVVKVKRR